MRIPVEAFPPKTIAIKVTMTTPRPLSPDFPIPSNKVAKNARSMSTVDKWKFSMSKSMFTLGQLGIRLKQFGQEAFKNLNKLFSVFIETGQIGIVVIQIYRFPF